MIGPESDKDNKTQEIPGEPSAVFVPISHCCAKDVSDISWQSLSSLEQHKGMGGLQTREEWEKITLGCWKRWFCLPRASYMQHQQSLPNFESISHGVARDNKNEKRENDGGKKIATLKKRPSWLWKAIVTNKSKLQDKQVQTLIHNLTWWKLLS